MSLSEPAVDSMPSEAADRLPVRKPLMTRLPGVAMRTSL